MDSIDSCVSPALVDLEAIIEDYAWKKFLKHRGWLKKMFARREKYRFEIDWESLDFEHKTTTKIRTDEDILLLSSDFNQDSYVNDSSLNRNRDSYRSFDISAPFIIGSSFYQNPTDVPKSFTFSSEKETTTTVSVEFTDSYSIGSNTNIKVSLPGDLFWDKKENIRDIHVTKSDRETFEEPVSWDVETDILVKPFHQTKAYFSVQEQNDVAEFEIRTSVTLSNTWLPVYIRRESDNKIIFTCLITNLNDVFKSYKSPNLRVKKVTGERQVQFAIILKSSGVCRIHGWSDEQVIVKSSTIRKERTDIF